MTVVDTSAIVAWLRDEAGADVVLRELAAGGLVMSTVNLAEVATVLARRGRKDAAQVLRAVQDSVEVLGFDVAQATRTGALEPLTAPLGLGLGDRACLALARERGEPVLTADRAWAELPSSVGVE
ncbi:MAG: type II toxin-antitoxin system VapC family toxin, partial [Actinomycetota bacterium]|nr:type II toxin-antitoxin system VapC family toxin [Actinomycetota bacterium]